MNWSSFGVDIFFVTSSYLITSIILKELVATGSFSFKHFYERRSVSKMIDSFMTYEVKSKISTDKILF